MLCASSGIILPPSSDEDRLLSSVINTVYPVCFQWQTDTGNYVSGVLMDPGIKYWRFSVSVASNATARAASTLFYLPPFPRAIEMCVIKKCPIE